MTTKLIEQVDKTYKAKKECLFWKNKCKEAIELLQEYRTENDRLQEQEYTQLEKIDRKIVKFLKNNLKYEQ